MVVSKFSILACLVAGSVALTGVNVDALAANHPVAVAAKTSTQALPATQVAAASPAADCGFKSLSVSPSLTGAKTGDLIGLRRNGELWRYPGRQGGGFAEGTKIGHGWGSMASLVFPGDLNKDGQADLLAIDTKGDLLFYPGNGRGSFGRSTKVGRGWTGLKVAAVGDMTGDGVGDLLGVKASGLLMGYAGVGQGKLRSYGQVGRGWQNMQLIGGALGGKGAGQFWGISTKGELFHWSNNGRGAPTKKTKVGHGWGGFTQVIGGVDLTGDGKADLLAWKPDGKLMLYPGKAGGQVSSGQQVGHGFRQHTTKCPQPPKAKHVVKYQVALKGNVQVPLKDFAATADQVLNDPSGWAKSDIYFQQVSSGGSFTLWLSEARYLPSFARICSTTYSCSVGSNVIINQDRWLQGAAPKVPISQYRIMVINHEVGHWLGFGHRYCSGSGQPAPLMMQQSKGLGQCTFNPYPLPSERKTPRFG